MTGIDLDVVRQRHQLLVDAVVELGGKVVGVGVKVRPADGADEQRVAGQDEPRIRTAAKIGDEKADAVVAVPRRVNDFDARIAEFDFLAVVEGFERKRNVRRLIQLIGRADFRRQRPPARTVIGVDVGVDHVGDAHALGRGELDVGIDVARLGVDHGAFAEAPTAEQIRGTAGVVIVVGPENHLVTPLTVRPCPVFRDPLRRPPAGA